MDCNVAQLYHIIRHMRFVLDTDVIRSGLQSATGASRLLLCGVAEGAFRPLVTVATLLEHEDVLKRPDSLAATGLTTQDVDVFVDAYVHYADRVAIHHNARPSIQDACDEIFVEALINGGGDAIVTFNGRDYLDADPRLASQGKTAVPVLAPGEALRRLSWRPTATTPFAFPPR
jgi:predicted nucleic acid-binding protein